jgi:hypothetical protein
MMTLTPRAIKERHHFTGIRSLTRKNAAEFLSVLLMRL